MDDMLSELNEDYDLFLDGLNEWIDEHVIDTEVEKEEQDHD